MRRNYAAYYLISRHHSMGALTMENPLEITIMTEPLDAMGRAREGIKFVVGRHQRWGHCAVTKGLIDLSAGPNIVVFSDDADGIIAREEIDLFLTNSKWVTADYIRKKPSLKGRIEEWPVGINMDYFSPDSPFCGRNSKKALIYHKDESEQFCWRIDYLLRKYGFKTKILTYGSYTLQEYKDLLNQVDLMIAVSQKESQGLFMLEAWSMDVPTICFDPHYYRWPGTDIEIAGNITTCPYLQEENGRRFMELQELEEIIRNWNWLKTCLHPRDWCKENLSDEVCA